MRSPRGGFSFIQILIVIILIVILGIVAVLIIKPSKILEKSRDAQRFEDMTTISAAINQYLADNHDFSGLVGPYSSIDVGFANGRAGEKIDGTGWIPLNFQLISTGSPIERLPIDPLNNVTYNYRFGVSVAGKTYEINCVFERPENSTKESSDGGNNPNAYELGTDLTIL